MSDALKMSWYCSAPRLTCGYKIGNENVMIRMNVLLMVLIFFMVLNSLFRLSMPDFQQRPCLWRRLGGGEKSLVIIASLAVSWTLFLAAVCFKTHIICHSPLTWCIYFVNHCLNFSHIFTRPPLNTVAWLITWPPASAWHLPRRAAAPLLRKIEWKYHLGQLSVVVVHIQNFLNNAQKRSCSFKVDTECRYESRFKRLMIWVLMGRFS